MHQKNTNELTFVEQIRKHIVDNNIMLSYQGEISQEIILALLDMTEKNLDSTKAEQAIKSKVFNVMVNCLQNITNHSDKKHNKSNMFTIGRDDSKHTVYSGNALKNENIPELKNKLEEIKKLTPDELNEFYRNWLRTKELNENKGIGLGLIDVARKTGSSLDYDFDEIDDDYSYFSLRTIIKNREHLESKEGISSALHTEQKSLRHYFNFHILAELNNIILLYSSDFTQELTKTLLSFTEKKLSSEGEVEDLVKRKVFNIMVELLQNISKNAVDKDLPFSEHLPIFMIGETDTAFKLISSNKIYVKHIDKIKSRIDQVNELDAAGLKTLYKEVRLQGKFSDVGGAGIGFIDMARKSGNKILYDFQSIDEEFSIYTVQIEVSKV